MHELNQLFLSKYTSDREVISVIAIDCKNLHTQLIDGFDFLYLVIKNDASIEDDIIHYSKDKFYIQEYQITPKRLQQWILTGSNRNIMQWILGGDIIFDRDGSMHKIREEWTIFPPHLRDKKLLIEFSSFLRVYTRCQEYLCAGQMMDAYSQVNAMLHHWARIYIIEAGLHPEVMVWRQVYDINPGVYKMYQELQESKETLQQRVELVLLAIDFSIVRRITDCSQMLLRLIGSREEAWTASQLMEQPSIEELQVDLNLVLQKLVGKHVLDVIKVEDAQLSGVFDVKYKLAKQA
jgi:hypothetical protein